MSDSHSDSNPVGTQACKQAAGQFLPVINRNRCEGKAACVPACPYDVLTIEMITAQQRKNLSIIGRIKATVHGGRQAQIIAPEQCHACGECVKACPEQAITLGRLEAV